MRFPVLGVAVCAIAHAAAAEPPRAAEITNQARAAEGALTTEYTIDGESVICRKDRIIGSRLTTKRMCLTEAQWRRKEAEEHETVEKIQSARWKNY